MIDPSQLDPSLFTSPAPSFGGRFGGLFTTTPQPGPTSLPGLLAPQISPPNVPPPQVNLPNATPINTSVFQNPQPSANTDFLANVREFGGSIIQGGLNVVDAPAHFIARPAFELLSEPMVFGEMLKAGEGDFLKTVSLLNEAFERNKAPGVVKFAGELALDPLTYLSAGTLKAATSAKYIKPLIAALPGGAAGVDLAVRGLTKYEKGVDAAFSGAGGLISGIAANYVPLTVAKQNATAILEKILPKGLVANMINAIPEEYTGIPIKGIADMINNRVPNLGLPTILRIPEVRVIQTAGAYNSTYDAARTSAIQYGINTGTGSNKKEIAWWLRDIYSKPQQLLTDEQAVVADVLKRPNPLNRTDLRALNRMTQGGLTTPTVTHAVTLNNLVEQYRANPANTVAVHDATVKGIAQLLDVNLKKNPDAEDVIARFLRGKSDESIGLINTFSELPVEDVVHQIAERARRVTDRSFTMRVETERINNTIGDQFLERFDNLYTTMWKDGIQKYFTFPLSKMYLEFTAYPVQNATESLVRHGIGGAGLLAPVDETAFKVANGLVPLTPKELLEGGGAITESSQLASRFQHSGPLGQLAKIGEPFLDLGNAMEKGIRRSYWNKVISEEIDNVAFAQGLGARTDLQDWFKAAKPPDVAISPELKGLSQKLVNEITSWSTRAVSAGPNAVEGVKAYIDAGLFRRRQVAEIISNKEFQNLHPESQRIWVQWANKGEASAKAANDTIQEIIDTEKKYIGLAPEALKLKFEGLFQHIKGMEGVVAYTGDDLINAVNHVRYARDQYVGIPEMMRQAERDAVEKSLGDGSYKQAIHNDFANRIAESLKATAESQEKIYASLISQADRLGYRPQAERMVKAMQQDELLLQKTWGEDELFRSDFFSTLDKKSRQAGQTWDDYYASRKIIWDGYGGQHATLQAELAAAELEFRNAINPIKAAPIVPPVTEPIVTTWKAAGRGNQQSNSGWRITKVATPDGSPAYSIFNPSGFEFGVPVKSIKEAKDAVQKQLELEGTALHPDPVINSMAEEIVNAAEKGTDPAEALAAANNRGNVIQGAESEGLPISDGGNSGVQQTIGAIENAGISGGNIGPSATAAAIDPADTLAARYAGADSLRSGLEAHIQKAFKNPAMSDAQQDALKAHIDNMQRVFNSLDQSNQKVLNDTLKEAAKRTRARYDTDFTNYNHTTAFDFLMKQVFPFWTYESRRWPYLLKTGLKNPGLAAAYANYMDKTDQGYIPVGEIPFEANPLRGTILGGLTRAAGRDYPMKYTSGLNGALESLESTLGKFGFYLGPQFSVPSQLFRGEAGQTLPAMASTALNIGRAADLPGAAALQNVLPDQFKDYYVNQILASQGHEPDKVFKAAAEKPNGTEAQIVDTAQRQASLVAVVLAQTGVLRYRTPEYNRYQQARAKAIEGYTGIPVAEQERLQQLGINIRQIATLTPTQRSELAAIPGTREFSQIAEPLLSPQAKAARESQREFFDTVKSERERLTQEQTLDDQRLVGNVISGVEWRTRYQERNGRVSSMVQDLKKSEAYKNVPISAEEQQSARQKLNLPAYIDSPVDIVLNEYRSVSPTTDGVTGEINWPQFFDDREAVLKKYPPELVAMAQSEINKNDTAAVRQFRQAMEILRPYFSIKDDILKAFPQLREIADAAQAMTNKDPVQGAIMRDASEELKLLNRMVSAYQQEARKRFPQIDAALVKFYGATPMEFTLMKQAAAKSGPFSGLFRT